MSKGYCDNTDCKGGEKIIYKIILTSDFDSAHCSWCKDCIARDFAMIDFYIL